MTDTVLLVDDEIDTLELLTIILKGKYQIITANSGRRAIEALQNDTIDLIISDIIMKDLDGFELCKMIKSDQIYCHIPVILLTAKNTLRSKIHGLELGADSYIEKPFSPALLLAQISSLISNRQNVHQLYTHPAVFEDVTETNKQEDSFLSAIFKAINVNLDNPDLDIDLLAKITNTSRATLYRKTKESTNLSPLQLINNIRMKTAARLLSENNHRVAEVASMTGFKSRSSFTRNFNQHFNQSPLEFARRHSFRNPKENDTHLLDPDL